MRDDILDTLISIACRNPIATYYELSEMFLVATGVRVTPAIAEIELRNAAVRRGVFSDFAKGSLIRHMRNMMRSGWGTDDHLFNFSHTIGAWGSRLGAENAALCENVAMSLSGQSIPIGWLPDSVTDCHLARAWELGEFKFSSNSD